MKFLVHAQLPRKVCSWLSDLGHEAKHTLDLPLKKWFFVKFTVIF